MPATIPTQEDLDVIKLAVDDHFKAVEAKLLEYGGLPEREKHDFADLELRVKKIEDIQHPPVNEIQEDQGRRIEALEGKLEELAAKVEELHKSGPGWVPPSDEPIMQEVHPVVDRDVYPVDPDNPIDPDGPPDQDPPPKKVHHKKK